MINKKDLFNEFMYQAINSLNQALESRDYDRLGDILHILIKKYGGFGVIANELGSSPNSLYKSLNHVSNSGFDTMNKILDVFDLRFKIIRKKNENSYLKDIESAFDFDDMRDRLHKIITYRSMSIINTANEMNVNRSTLTNFLNRKRPVHSKNALIFLNYIDLKEKEYGI